ncbi:hypothetical protein ACPVPU_14445 [Sphingomonas sp. CJ99]
MNPALTAIIACALTAAGSMPLPASTKDRPTGEAALAERLDGRVADKAQSCVSFRQLRGTTMYRGVGILYQGPGSTLYLNRGKGGSLDQLSDDSILVTVTPLTQLCANDTVRLVDRVSGFDRGFVILGDFVPYRRAPAAE